MKSAKSMFKICQQSATDAADNRYRIRCLEENFKKYTVGEPIDLSPPRPSTPPEPIEQDMEAYHQRHFGETLFDEEEFEPTPP
jgi:hypothetical protein